VNPGEKGKYIKIILSLLQSTSSAVVYECAVTLVSLSQAPTAIRAAANCYCQLLVSQSDNNVKLIVLDRLQVCHSYSLAEIARNQKLRKPWTAK
jgi:coatomer subunit beta